MDIERAVDDFVHKGKDLFRLLRSEGGFLSPLGLGVLRTQLHILTVEAARLNSQQPIAKKTDAVPSTREADVCAHGRAIDNYIDENGKRTNLFYCLECGSVIEAPTPPSQM